MKPTKEEKQRLRAHWSHLSLRFRADGSVEGKKGESWGILLTPRQLEDTLKLWRSEKGPKE